MYTYSQLLARNTLYGIGIFIIVAIATVFTFEGFVHQQQSQHSKTLTAVSENVLIESDVKTLAMLLRKSNDYQLLSISTNNGENLYNYQNEDTHLLTSLISPAISQVRVNDIVINYQLSSSLVNSLITMLVVSFLGFTLLVVIFLSLASKKHYTQLFSNVCAYIKDELNNIHEPKENQRTSNIHIPELKEGLASIRETLAKAEQQSSVLKEEAYVDHLTHLANRNGFIKFFQAKISQGDEIKFGVMLISRCSELQTINKIHGYKEGDNYICQVSDIIKKEIARYKGGEIFRLNSSDFASVIPNITLKEAENYAQALTSGFNDYQQSSDLDSVAFTGLVSFDNKKPLGELLALIDTAISVAQTQHMNSWYSQTDSSILNNPSANYGNQNWRQEIENVLEAQRVSLVIQPIQTNKATNRMYGEILARFLNADGSVLPTASFIAMAEKLDKIVAVDRMIIEKTIQEIINKNLQKQSFGINISARSIHDEHFLIWLERRLLRDQNIASKLVFEITELGLQQNIKTSKRFIDMIHRVGARITVERFGVGLTSFKFFKELKPDFIKMDSSYTRDIDEDKNNQYFIRVMVDLAHRLSINVLAESVETLEEKHALEQLFVDGFQGYYIGKPEPI
ncbi:EAL domain-containing protein [Thalassotalea agariperforans]